MQNSAAAIGDGRVLASAFQDTRNKSLTLAKQPKRGLDESVLDLLLAAHRDLAQDVMARAARITGTTQQLSDALARLERAIEAARRGAETRKTLS